METTKVSEVTTRMKVEEVINDYTVSGTVEVDNNTGAVKQINVSITKEGIQGSVNYNLSRSASNCSAIPGQVAIPGDEALAVGVEFESRVSEIVANINKLSV